MDFSRLNCLLPFLFRLHVGKIFGVPYLFLLFAVFVIIAQIRTAGAPVRFDHFGDDTVQEIAVVGYNKHCAAVIQEIGLQPDDRAHVKMVGRLIEQDDIGSGEKERAEGYAGLLASREC